MAINFPSNPSTNDTHTVNNRVWQYDGEKWGVVGANLEPVVASLTVGGDFTVDSATLKVDSVNNRVGIGTTSPAAALDVAATGANAVHTHGQVRIDGTDPSRLTLGSTDGSTNLWNIDNYTGVFRVYREDWNATGTGANGSVKLAITDTGNVGIGTTTPGTLLELKSSGPLIRITSNNTTPGDGTLLGGLEWYGSDADASVGLGAYIAAYGDGTLGEYQLRIGTGTQGTTAVRMTIDSSGKVGIGTSSPAANLQVVSQNRAFSVLDTGANNQAEIGFTTLGGDIPAFGNISGYDVKINTGTSRAGLATRVYVNTGGSVYVESNQNSASGNVLKVTNLQTADTSVVMSVQHGNATPVSPGGWIRFNDSGGTEHGKLVGNGAGISLYSASDQRIKTAIVDADKDASVAVIKALQVRDFMWDEDGDGLKDEPGHGFIAQEVAQVLPAAASGDPEGMEPCRQCDACTAEENVELSEEELLDVCVRPKIKRMGVSMELMIPDLVAALQNALARIEALEAN